MTAPGQKLNSAFGLFPNNRRVESLEEKCARYKKGYEHIKNAEQYWKDFKTEVIDASRAILEKAEAYKEENRKTFAQKIEEYEKHVDKYNAGLAEAKQLKIQLLSKIDTYPALLEDGEIHEIRCKLVVEVDAKLDNHANFMLI